MAETWHSDRFWSEEHHKQLIKIFDEFVDLALEGTITLEQALVGWQEVLHTAEEVDGTTDPR